MKDFPIRNIFLPATLVGASIFSAMAFALPSFVDHYGSLERSPKVGMRSSLALAGVHKELIITYVGSAVVVSTSAGLGAAELLRQRAARKGQNAELKSALAEFVDAHAQQSSPDLERNFSSLVAQHLDSAAVIEASPASASTDSTPESDPVAAKTPAALWPSVASDAIGSELLSSAHTEADDTVMIFPGQYQRCRIHVPNAPEQQYAIAFDQQFYGLLSSGVSKEEALAAVQQLAQEERAAILTPMNQGYAVWVLEPEATLVAVA
jgi:hypothetical protein